MEKKEKRTVSHIVSLVLGIISILSNFFWYISLPTGIAAIVLGTTSYKKENKKMGVAGLVTGIIGVALCLFIYITLIVIAILANYY
ncbi:MAG: hypothetical protein IJI43_01990 [Bacilli bacterium]|nr:hypothetical protein [Bacilli bacterium]MBQ6538673.1 hypothetical protein [Bacilli bacterium]